MPFYIVSKTYLGDKPTLYPKEDSSNQLQKIKMNRLSKRIRAFTCIADAVRGTCDNEDVCSYYVYRTEKIRDAISPSVIAEPDAEVTNVKWLKNITRFKCEGIIKVGSPVKDVHSHTPPIPFYYAGDRGKKYIAYLYHREFEWLNRFGDMDNDHVQISLIGSEEYCYE